MKNVKINELTFAQIEVGNIFEFAHTFQQNDVDVFMKLSGDYNPLHHDQEFAKTTEFEKPIIHGALVSSLFSTLVGVHCPGKHCLYLSQTLKFHKPIFVNEELNVKGEVLSKHESLNSIILKTEVFNKSERCISGKATVKVLK